MEENPQRYVSEVDQGFGNTIEIKKILCDVQTRYQHIKIYETANLGKLLMLDDIIQLTEFDEYAYQEMMTHPAMLVHPNPVKVLIIGGGDGGVAREVARHKCVKQIDQCEIDGKVVEASLFNLYLCYPITYSIVTLGYAAIVIVLLVRYKKDKLKDKI